MTLLSVLLTIFNVIIFVVIVFYLFRILLFLRDPAREVPQGNNMVSPADGKVVEVSEKSSDVGGVKVKKGFGKIYTLTKDVASKCYMVSISINPFDVHITRTPVEGRIEKITYEKGRLFPKKSNQGLVNDKNEIIIRNRYIGRMKVIQIAGLITKKMECLVKEKENVLKGQKIGRTNLCSQVTMIIPKSVTIKIRKGKKVKAGETIIAEY